MGEFLRKTSIPDIRIGHAAGNDIKIRYHEIARDAIMASMRGKHRKTLQALFNRPTSAGIVFSDIETLIVAMGGQIREGEGSRVAFELGQGARLYMHRPHPGKEAKKYQVEKVRAWLESKGVKP